MAYTTGRCPNCGADSQLDENKDEEICTHCGDHLQTRLAVARLKAEYPISLSFYYCVYSGNEQGKILFYEREVADKPTNELVLKVTLDIPDRRFFVTDEYVFFSNGSYKTYLYNRKDKKTEQISCRRTSNHYIIDDTLFCRDCDDNIGLIALPIKNTLFTEYDESDWKAIIKTTGFASQYTYGDWVKWNNCGFYSREWTNSGELFTKINMDGSLLYEKSFTVKDSDVTAFDVYNDVIYFVQAIETENWPHTAQIVRSINFCMLDIENSLDEIIEIVEEYTEKKQLPYSLITFDNFFHHFNNPHVAEICVSEYVIAVRIWGGERDWDKEGHRIEFYTKRGKFIAKVIGFYKRIFAVHNQVFILTNEKETQICYVYKNRIECRLFCDGEIVVQPTINIKNKASKDLTEE